MNLPRPNRKLEQTIQQEVKKLVCPIHNKTAEITMPDENKDVIVKACCPFFAKDVTIVGERMRKDFIYKAEKTRERLDREWKKGKREGK
jgi:hypothetical protein